MARKARSDEGTEARREDAAAESAALFPALQSSGAKFSACRAYRYTLWRTWDAGKARICFVMLNPSTADETQNDPTVERCERRARRMGFGGLLVVNIFALRSTDPAALYAHADPVGPENDRCIVAAAQIAGLVVCAWGTHGKLHGRGVAVAQLLAAAGVGLHCLGVTKSGQPRHPLYVGYDVMLRGYRVEVQG